MINVKYDVGIAKCDNETINVRMKPSNVRKKINEPQNVINVKYDVGIAKCDNETIKCEKKNEPLNVTKVLSNVMLEWHNVRIEPSNMRKKKKGNHKM